MSINKVAPLLLSAFSALKRAKVSRSTRIQAPPSPQPQPQPAQKCAGRQESRGKSRRRGGKSVVAHGNYTHASALTRELNLLAAGHRVSRRWCRRGGEQAGDLVGHRLGDSMGYILRWQHLQHACSTSMQPIMQRVQHKHAAHAPQPPFSTASAQGRGAES